MGEVGRSGQRRHQDRHKQTQRVGGNALIQDGWPGCREAAEDKAVRTASPDQRPISVLNEMIELGSVSIKLLHSAYEHVIHAVLGHHT